MFTPADVDLLNNMVGHDRFKDGYPLPLVKEYNIRAGMLDRCGRTGGLGVEMMMQLLRDFQINPVGKPTFDQVKDWRDIERGTKIYYRGDGGVFCSVGEDGKVFVKIDGRRSEWEVSRADVKIRVVDGPAPDEDADPAVQPVVIESDDDDAGKITHPANDPSEADLAFQEWIAVAPGTKVMAQIDGVSVEAEFIEIGINGTNIDLSVPTGEDDEYTAVTVHASQVQLPVEA